MFVFTKLSDYTVEEHMMNWIQFGSLDKVDLLKYSNDMICAEVAKSTKTKLRLKESLNKSGDLLKVEIWTTREKLVTIKELEEIIVTLLSNPNDGS